MAKTLLRRAPKTQLAPAECAACGSPLEGEFCAACGEHKPERLTIGSVLARLKRGFTQLEFNPLRTIVELARAPGQMLRNYLNGDRTRFTNPVGFLFLASTGFILVNSWLNRNSELARIFDPFELRSTFWPYSMLWPYAIYLLIIPGALLHRALFAKRNINLAETYTTALYLVAQLVIFETLLLPLTWRTQSPFVRIPVTLMEAGYVAWAITRMHEDRSPSVWLRGALVFAGYAAGIVGAIMFIGWSILSLFK